MNERPKDKRKRLRQWWKDIREYHIELGLTSEEATQMANENV